MKYLFPFSSIPKDSPIILYGASDVGYDFYRQIKSSGYANLVAWIDRNYEMYRMLDLPVDPPASIQSLSYDYIVVSALEDKSFRSIRESIISLGIGESKIIWSPNVKVGHDLAKKHSYEQMALDAKEAYETDPEELLSEERLDIVVRYIFAREILNETEDGVGKKLYEKMFEAINQAVEPTDHFLYRYFSDYEEKRGINAFEEAFRKLIFSIRDEGFKRECFVPLNKKGGMINGAHRCAAALALDANVWVRNYPIEGVKIADHHFGEEWFFNNGFSDDEMKMIKIAYDETKGKTVNRRVVNEITRRYEDYPH